MAMILNEEQTMLKDSAKDFCTTNTLSGNCVSCAMRQTQMVSIEVLGHLWLS